jgi:predicted acetyltransferase
VSITADLATADETELLRDLWQLYMKDLATIRNSVIQADGRFVTIDCEPTSPMTITFLSDQSKGEIVGFALVRKSKPDTHVIGEFFIKSQFRRSGIGGSAVSEILHKFVGNWEIPFQEENLKAAIFWRRKIPELGYQTTEANLLNDVWLNFTTADTK